jgi:hypothetical protein
MKPLLTCTLLELVQVLNEVTDNDREVVATAISLVNSGRVRLCGNFANAKITLSTTSKPVRASRRLSLRSHAIPLSY